MKVNPILKIGRVSRNHFLSITLEEYATSMIELFDRWYNDPNSKIKISPFEEIMKGLITGHVMGCNYSGHCQDNFIGINANGDIYPCGRYIGIEETKLGNILEDKIEEVNSHVLRQEINQRRDICKEGDCEIKNYCNSGCSFDSYITYGNVKEKTIFCEANKLVFGHIYGILSKEL